MFFSQREMSSCCVDTCGVVCCAAFIAGIYCCYKIIDKYYGKQRMLKLVDKHKRQEVWKKDKDLEKELKTRLDAEAEAAAEEKAE